MMARELAGSACPTGGADPAIAPRLAIRVLVPTEPAGTYRRRWSRFTDQLDWLFSPRRHRTGTAGVLSVEQPGPWTNERAPMT